jgi:hypothetical protein
VSGPRTPPPKGLRRVERWFVGLALAVVAFILERVVLRAVRKEGRAPDVDVDATTFTSKGGDVDLPEL